MSILCFGRVKACHSHLYKSSNRLCSLFEAKYHRRGRVEVIQQETRRVFTEKMSAGD